MNGVTTFCSVHVIALAGLAAFAPLPAQAADGMQSPGRAAYQIAQLGYTDVLVMLERTGYKVVKMDSTLLGRVRILARNREHLREVIVSRSTGEIKRDVILKRFATGNNDRQTASGQRGVTANASTGGGTTNVSVSGSAGTGSGSASVSVSTGSGSSTGSTGTGAGSTTSTSSGSGSTSVSTSGSTSVSTSGSTSGSTSVSTGGASVSASTGGVSVDAGGVSAGASTGGLGLGN